MPGAGFASQESMRRSAHRYGSRLRKGHCADPSACRESIWSWSSRISTRRQILDRMAHATPTAGLEPAPGGFGDCRSQVIPSVPSCHKHLLALIKPTAKPTIAVHRQGQPVNDRFFSLPGSHARQLTVFPVAALVRLPLWWLTNNPPPGIGSKKDPGKLQK